MRYEPKPGIWQRLKRNTYLSLPACFRLVGLIGHPRADVLGRLPTSWIESFHRFLPLRGAGGSQTYCHNAFILSVSAQVLRQTCIVGAL
eukprot:2788771-Pyramimonas_sp.AAC.1